MSSNDLKNLHRKVEAVRTVNAANEPLRELFDEILAEHSTARGTGGDQLAGWKLPIGPFQLLARELSGFDLARELRGGRSLDCDLTWRRDGAGWVLLYKRRRMGRVLPDNQRRGMYRSVLSRSRLSDMANLSWAKSAVLAVAIRELAWESRSPYKRPPKWLEKQGVFNGSARPCVFRPTVGSVTAAPSASALRPALCIEHSVTADMADGQALPPCTDHGVVWQVVRRIDGRTMWRRISLANQTNAAIGT